MPGISAGLFQKDSYLLWLMHGWFAGYVAPRAVSLTACRLWLSAVAHPVPIVICRPGLVALLWCAHRSSGTRLDLWCFDLGLRYQRWRRLLKVLIRGEVRGVSRVTSVFSAARAVRTHVVSLVLARAGR